MDLRCHHHRRRRRQQQQQVPSLILVVLRSVEEKKKEEMQVPRKMVLQVTAIVLLNLILPKKFQVITNDKLQKILKIKDK